MTQTEQQDGNSPAGVTPAARIGPYEVAAALGAGGMGEVLRARDPKLGREVAIKVLPAAFAQDAERVARFRREAQILASLNHPNIAAIHGLEESAGALALVMELVEGEDLAQRLKRGAIPVEEAIAIAKQIAEALEEAHEKGIVHRDLKPGNVKVTVDGKVKVLDFGLAKAYMGADPMAQSGSHDLSQSPTLAGAGTMAGVILGTAAYMSPEQARGKAVDKRADIWSFGVVLYEMLSGRRLFEGETVSDTLAAVLTREPEWRSLPVGTPRAAVAVLHRCLQKDPRQRVRDIGDARMALAEPDLDPGNPGRESSARPGRSRRLVATAITALVVGAAGGAWWRASRDAPRQEWTATRLGGPAIATDPRVAPDGQLIAFMAMVDGLSQVAVMKPGTQSWTVLTRDRGHGLAQVIAWSPDGSRLYYDRQTDAPNGIYSVPSLGGEERLVIENAAAPQPLADGSLLFIRMNAKRHFQLHRLWPGTGKVEGLPAITTYWAAQRAVPTPLPDGRIVFFGRPTTGAEGTEALYTMSLDSHEMRRLNVDVADSDLFALAVRPGDGAILLAAREGSMYRILELAHEGATPRTLMTLLDEPRLAPGPDGVVYMSLQDRPNEVFRFREQRAGVEPLATGPNLDNSGTTNPFVSLTDGRVLVATRQGGRGSVMAVAPGHEPASLVETNEETRAPMTPVGTTHVALMIGSGAAPDIALVAADTGRVSKRLSTPQGTTSLGAAPDGQTLYVAANGVISVNPLAGGAPRVLCPGDSLAVDPDSGDLIVKLDEHERFRLVRVSPAGGTPRPIPLGGDLRLVQEPLTPGAVRGGRLLLPVATVDSWYWFPGVLDLRSGRLERMPLDYFTDIHAVTWAPDGRVVGWGVGMQGALWKFAPLKNGRPRAGDFADTNSRRE